MRWKRLCTIALTVVVVGALVLAWRSQVAARSAREALAALEAKRIALDRKVRQDREKTASAVRDRAKLEAALAAARTGASSAGPAPSAAARKPSPSVASLLAADPKLMALYLKDFRSNLQLRFGGHYKAMGLTPEQIDKWEELATAHEAELQDLQASAESQGLRGDPAIGAMRQQSNQQFTAAVAQIVGPAAAQGFPGTAAASQPIQGLVNGIDRYALANSAPLTLTQAGQLADIVAAATPGTPGGARYDPMTTNWDTVTAQAGGILSAPQMQALQTQAQLMNLAKLVRQYYSAKQ